MYFNICKLGVTTLSLSSFLLLFLIQPPSSSILLRYNHCLFLPSSFTYFLSIYLFIHLSTRRRTTTIIQLPPSQNFRTILLYIYNFFLYDNHLNYKLKKLQHLQPASLHHNLQALEYRLHRKNLKADARGQHQGGRQSG